MSIEENVRGIAYGDHKPGPVEADPTFNPDAEYEAKLSDLMRQRGDFLKGISEYQGYLAKVAELRTKLKNPNLFTSKEDIDNREYVEDEQERIRRKLAGSGESDKKFESEIREAGGTWSAVNALTNG